MIRTEWNARHFKGVQDEIHRLHGACCYTGVPKLQALANQIESNLKLGKHAEMSEQLPAIILECEIVAAQANKFIQENSSD
jgi:two-component system sensor histidine kinase BarA